MPHLGNQRLRNKFPPRVPDEEADETDTRNGFQTSAIARIPTKNDRIPPANQSLRAEPRPIGTRGRFDRFGHPAWMPSRIRVS